MKEKEKKERRWIEEVRGGWRWLEEVRGAGGG